MQLVLKLVTWKNEHGTHLSTDDDSLTASIYMENDVWVVIYIDNTSGEIVKVIRDDADYPQILGETAVHLFKIWFGVVIP